GEDADRHREPTHAAGHPRAGRRRAAPPGRAAQAPARPVLPPPDGDAAPRDALRLAAGARLRGAVREHLHGAHGQGPRPGPAGRVERLRRRDARHDLLRLPDHGAALRPLRALRRPRPAPRPAEDRLLALPGHRRGADLRRGQRRRVLELLHLLRDAGLRDRLRRLGPLPLRASHRRPAARRGLPAPGGARRLGQAHRGRRPRARRRGPLAGRDARLHLADPAARQRAALARRDRRPRAGARGPPGPGGHHRRPGLPAGEGGRARRPVPP
ncbi:MAG: Exopolysaccharide biosynthesis polyprenyl glycosylphosphotransferase, partial [uncultured Solirubrobacteraceae bacterium]